MQLTRKRLAIFFLLALAVFAGSQPLAQSLVDSTTTFTIQPQDSILRVYVGRAGPLARMGHNHVVHSRELSGEIILEPDFTNSSASFSFPVSSFVVDDTEERQRAGDGFESQPDESAISGTRDNMLGEDVLNASAYPEITINVSPGDTQQEPQVFTVEIGLLGSSFTQELPASLSVNDNTLNLSASFSLEHEDLGLSPFSALGGALRVAETIDFELSITARAE